MRKIQNPHDKFFRVLMDHPQAAAALLRERLPPTIAAMLADEPPKLVDASFIDENLRNSQADRLFRARLKQGATVYIYCLVEHKSKPDPLVTVQLICYLGRIWKALSRKFKKGGRLPAVFPLVVYHGVPQWTVPRDFLGVVNTGGMEKSELLNFRYGLVNLGKIPNRNLSQEQVLRAGLLVLKLAVRAQTKEEQMQTLERVLREIKGLDDDFLCAALIYNISVLSQLDRGAIETVIHRAAPEQESEMLSIAAREWLKEGREEGREEGRREALLRLLERRFGRIPDRVRQLVLGAQISDLTRWFDRGVDAHTLEEVFKH